MITALLTTGADLIGRAQQALAEWYATRQRNDEQLRLAQLKQRLKDLPDQCQRARDAAHASYVHALRHIDKHEAVEAIELEYEIKELEARL